MTDQHRVLVANRGEIAVRIIRAAQDLGWPTVAVHTAAEAGAPHVRLADEARQLDGEGPAGYLDADRLVAVGQETGCTIVQPGYGFLAEDARFARACAAAGLAFAGPDPAVLEALGDKVEARRRAVALDLPVLAGTDGPATLAEAQALFAATDPGGAVVVKAVAGGGGRGIRVVEAGAGPAALEAAYARCRSEAAAAFGRDEVYVERHLRAARHVEVQLVGDGTGAVAILGDRDCSVQRRHQKLIEIAPAPGLPASLRAALADDAERLGASLRYRGVGTVEFLIDAAGNRYFLEVNPRLQVEHTVTEEVYRFDLVAASLRLAAGATLAELGVTAAAPTGYAVQARVNAETLDGDGVPRPSVGVLTAFTAPGGPGIRVDAAVLAGERVTGRFDSLLAKVIAATPSDRPEDALRRLVRALAETTIDGVGTNLPLLRAVLAHPDFRPGAVTTDFLDSHAAELMPAQEAETVSADGALVSPVQGVVVAINVKPGDEVRAGQELVVVEAMKMEHVVLAPAAGLVTAVGVALGDAVGAGTGVLALDPSADRPAERSEDGPAAPTGIRADLAEVRRRQALLLDDARPDAVARRHAAGRRTARENLADLVDDGSWVEYGGLAVAAQRARRSVEDLIARTPADGVVGGLARVNGADLGDEQARCAVLSYDYTVLAGTQGAIGHRKKDRLFEVIERLRLPVVLFAEGGGGRPGDTDYPVSSALDTLAFTLWAGLSGLVPRIAVASGRCFAGNAALAGSADLIIATKDLSIGMGGPAMIAGGGLGTVAPDAVGPAAVQAANGVLDLVVDDDAAAVAAAKQALGYFQGSLPRWECADQELLREVVPANRLRVYDVRRVVELLADTGSVLELRAGFEPGMVTALARVEGRPVGLVANNPLHLGGAITSDGADKAARFLQLCDAFDLPVVTLIDTPGMMVGPDAERTGLVRHCSRLFLVGASLTVPLVSVILRKAYGLGAQAMAGGSIRNPLLTVAWPTGELGAMGFEGAVELALRKELAAIEDPAVRRATAAAAVEQLYERGSAVSAAMLHEIDDVVDPAETRRLIVGVLRSAPPVTPGEGRKRSFVDAW